MVALIKRELGWALERESVSVLGKETGNGADGIVLLGANVTKVICFWAVSSLSALS